MAAIGKLDWNDLRYLLAAAQAGTLAGAARSLGVKHSTVGRRLTALERALGAAVVMRSERGLLLTPLGHTLVPYAQAVERAVADLQSQAAARASLVRVGVPTGLFKFLTPHLARFRRAHPEISLEFLSSSEPVDLTKGEAELALRVGPIADQRLIARKVGQFGWSLYASAAYLAHHRAPKDARDLAGHDVLGFQPRLAAVPGAKWIAEHGAGASIVLVNREIAEMAEAAAAGLGIAALPCIVGDSEPGLQRLTPEVIGRNEVSIVYRREVALAKSVRVVARFVHDVMRPHALAAK